MMKITGLSHLFKWENLLNWWLTKYFFAPLYILSLQKYLDTWLPNVSEIWGTEFIHPLKSILQQLIKRHCAHMMA